MKCRGEDLLQRSTLARLFAALVERRLSIAAFYISLNAQI